METILVADDAPDILDLARDILTAAGYAVLTATNGEEAQRAADRHPGPIHALLADVVMPKLTGPQLADRLVRSRGDMKVIFMSGYTAEITGQYGLVPSGSPFVGKPFTPEQLLGKLREALEYRLPFARPASAVPSPAAMGLARKAG